VPLFTIGHSTRTFEEFHALLETHRVQRVADVRTVPRSRRHPQFNKETLAAELPPRGIHYVHLPALGGLRKPRKDSPNAGWRNESFRGYADHMLSAAFTAALDDLLALAAVSPIAVMCAEAVPWRCHRSLIADAALARGVQARHMVSLNSTLPHAFTPFAHIGGIRVTYPCLGL
jgi:uncharacterized protein (DUF488 family)